MGLTAGPVPNRVDATVKAGLLGLIDHAEAKGWTRRRAAIRLGLDDSRAQRWLGLRQAGHSLADAPGGGNPLHGLLECEREAIIAVFEAWADTDRSHRKLAHRGSRIGMVHVSESTFLRVLRSEQLIPPGNPVREPIPRKPWPDWLVWKPNRIWGYDFTHFTRCQRAVIAVMDIVSRKWLSTVVSAEETSSQIEVAFTDALESENLLETAWRHGSAELRAAMARGDRETLEQLTTSGDLPLLLTISDNGPQMRSVTTREFMAGVAIAQQFGRPYTPTDQAWIESLFGHVKAEWPQLEQMTDPGELVAELETARIEYNTIRLHESLGYVTPEDEHEGRGEEIRQARRLGLQQARQTRIQYHRQQQAGTP
jgi:transposase InsO family protein